MKIFYALITTMAFASDLRMPENCAEFLQMTCGVEDRPCKEYSLRIEKGKSLSSRGQIIPVYHLRADGIPKGKKFQIANRNALGMVTVVFEGIHIGDGKVLSKQRGLSTCEPIVCGGFEIGEPSQFLLLDPDSNTTNAVFYLPYPAEPAIMDGLRVNMHYINNNPQAYLFDMENLIPGEKVRVTSSSDSDSMDSEFIASESGKAASFVAWVSPEMPSGMGSFEVSRESGTLAIQFHWVRESSHLPSPLLIFTVDHAPTAKEIEFARQVYFMPPFISGSKKV